MTTFPSPYEGSLTLAQPLGRQCAELPDTG